MTTAEPKVLSVEYHVAKVHSIIVQMLCYYCVGVGVNLWAESFALSVVGVFVSFGLIFALAFTVVEAYKKLYTSLFAFGFGLMTSVLVYEAYVVDPGIIILAVVGTSLIFVTFTGVASYIPASSNGILGGFLFVSLLVSIVASVALLFFPETTTANLIITWFTLIIFCGYIAYDTKEMYIRFGNPMAKHDHYHHAMNMFLNLINVFTKLLKLLQEQKKKKDKKN
ncbi:MAG: hypothetical protein Hyperionvirus15_30 [Hyperionvirus sp.]|uniref:Uncharacterized protein n=1 Tax=Hyperionvirus sp. TaxID=2487770 RepID=A0A3G5AA90_9VIRU|nr:MAG: hypothetical protein Hyperionvirus15_30 [Hyperionvirus sp.]